MKLKARRSFIKIYLKGMQSCHLLSLKEQTLSKCLFKFKCKHLSRLMEKPTICICENKGADQLRGNHEADQRLCFRYTDIVQSLYFLKMKFHASSCLLLLYSPVCVGPVRKPHCWFSHEGAHFKKFQLKCVFHNDCLLKLN